MPESRITMHDGLYLVTYSDVRCAHPFISDATLFPFREDSISLTYVYDPATVGDASVLSVTITEVPAPPETADLMAFIA